uniref:VWFA domain-containing protein n=1 Tax=Anopheles funestus TaxID=62324 RepID=A0A4Y0BK12_ANOFN
MYPPILVLVLALVSISRQTSTLELQEDDGRESDSYSSSYGSLVAAGTGSLLSYSGSTGAMQDEAATITPNNVAAAPSIILPPSDVLDSVYYQPHNNPEHQYRDPLGSSEEDRAIYPDSNNSSELSGVDDQYLTTSSSSLLDYGSSLLTSSERNDSAESVQSSSTDNEARASVPQAFVSEHDEPVRESPEDQHLHRAVHHHSREEPSLSSRALEHHHLHQDLPSETTNHLYNGVDTGSSGGTGVNDSAEHFTSPDGENNVEDTQEDDVLQLATTTTVPPGPLVGTSPDQDGNVDHPPAVLHPLRPTKPVPASNSGGSGIDESKLSKPELLAQLIADKNLRMPIAFLVDTSNDSLAFTKKVLEASLVPKSPLDAILMRYNATGISKSITFRNTKSLMEAVNLLQPSYDRGGSEYYSILRTSQEIPYDSAIFLATSRATTDSQLSRMTALTLLKKRIRLYVIWFGEEIVDSKQQLDQPMTNQTALHELAHKTGGRVIHFEIDRYFGSNPVLTTLLSQHDLHGTQSIPVSVGEDVNSLYFKLHGHIDQATLETPNGTVIDLFHDKKHNYTTEKKSHSTEMVILTESKETPLLLYQLNQTQPGHYRLNVTSSSAPGNYYNITIKTAQIYWHGIDLYEVGPVAATVPELWEKEAEESLSNAVEGNINLQPYSGGSSKLPKSNSDEHRFARQTELIDEDSGIISGRASIQAITKVDVGVNSQLIGARGQALQLYFEVTNYRQTPITYFFRVTDELAFLRSLNPGQVTLSPGQSIIVTVALVVTPTAEIGSRDKVTFSTTGVDSVSQAAWVTVSDSAGLADSTRPSLWYTYSSRCEFRSTPATCTGAFWTLEVMARDWETGLMRISSNPAGLLYKTPFTAGTRDEVRASYTASCCQPRVTITAYDVSRNVRSLNLDVTDIWLNEAGIAAVVLGILLFIALIILLVLLIRYCIRKRRQSKELPIYRGGESLSTRRAK